MTKRVVTGQKSENPFKFLLAKALELNKRFIPWNLAVIITALILTIPVYLLARHFIHEVANVIIYFCVNTFLYVYFFILLFVFEELDNNDSINLIGMLMRLLRKLPRIIVTNILYSVICFWGSYLFIIPGIFLSVRYIFAQQAGVYEEPDISPFKFGSYLLRGNVKLVLSLLLLIQLPIIAVYQAAAIYLLSSKLSPAIYFIVSAFWLVVFPLVPAISYALYKYAKKAKVAEMDRNHFKPMNFLISAGIALLVGSFTFLVLLMIILPKGFMLLFVPLLPYLYIVNLFTKNIF